VRLRGEIPREQYDAHPGVRWSLLSHMRKSPAHYQHALSHPRSATSALNTGSALHALVFEPETYAERFTTYTASKTKGEGARKAWDAFQEDSQARGLTILDTDEGQRAEGMAAAVRVKAGSYIAPSKGRAEIPITWTDAETGLVCKARLDWLTIDRLLIDLKSTRSTEERAFANQAWKLGYFHQQIFYSMGVAAATGCTLEEVPFLFAAVESEPPYDVALFEPCEESRYAALEDVRKLMERLAECQRTQRWRGRYDEPRMLKAPAYVLMTEDDEWTTEVT
jgi:hypothetical protein